MIFSLFKIASKSIRQRALSSVLTGLSVALGVSLVVIVLVVNAATRRNFDITETPVHLIIGAKGSPLQLTLNTLYHVSQPVENLPYEYYLRYRPTAEAPPGVVGAGLYAGEIEIAVPYALGDSYEGHRIVGTIHDFFDRFPVRSGEPYEFAQGGNFRAGPQGYFDAVVGSHAARETGLRLGDEFQPIHGGGEAGHEHHEAFEVVGVLEATGTPNDRAIFVNLEGFYRMEGHLRPEDAARETLEGQDRDHRHEEGQNEGREEHAMHAENGAHEHAGDIPIDQKEVTAILVRLRPQMLPAPDGGFQEFPADARAFATRVNEGFVAQAVQPVVEMRWLLDAVVGNIHTLVLTLAGLIVVVSGVSILVSIYNSMSERRREIAIMRALGARRYTVLGIVLVESILLCIGGGLLGFVLGHVVVAAGAPIVEQQMGVAMSPFTFDALELVLIPGMLLLASLVGLLPAIAAYRTDVARSLSAA